MSGRRSGGTSSGGSSFVGSSSGGGGGLPEPSPRRLRAIARGLEAWFETARRDLPWRRRRTGYRALVAEAMLQQTQVKRVVEPYRAFMRRFPTVAALAAADEHEVLSFWRGLGYYRRARMLHEAARAIVERHGGRVPRTAATLRELPGVGRYTAGAIASIVYGERAAIVDGNVQRVLARVFAVDRPPSSTEAMRWTWSTAEAFARAAPNAGAANEALMELGATVCTPAAPKCESCPAARWCEARKRGLTGTIPPPKRVAPRKRLVHHAVVVSRENGRGREVLVHRRPAEGLWPNLWQVPTVEAERSLSPPSFRGSLPVEVRGLGLWFEFDHGTSHRDIRFRVYRGRPSGEGTGAGVEGARWMPAAELDELAVSNAQRRILDRVREEGRSS